MSTRFETVDELLTEALSLAAEDLRGFMTNLTATDPDLAAEVSELLGKIIETSAFLGQDAERARDELLQEAIQAATLTTAQGFLQSGDSLGAFRIDRVIGKGLRSVVYLAERQDEEWSQRVAIKVMTPGVSSDDVYRRFLSERQILTSLRHPNIASLLDGGITAMGQPYVVLEYIDGLPISEYCRANRLPLRERVQLFRKVCEAVSHAHKHLVVHRDIKPSNILVSTDGEVKLLDFGIAKLLQPEVGAPGSMLTEEFSRPMTPAYSSPEQLAGGTVTTATDVYQLGLLLAEILTEAHPIRDALGIEGSQLPSRAPSQIPLGQNAGPGYHLRDLRGDLDWVVLKALEPEPEDRYGSAAELLLDVSAYLQQKPVSARSSTLPYIARKFVRRRPGLALAAGLSALALVGYVLLLAHFNTELARERAAAVEIKNLMIRFISSPDPYSGSGADTRVSELLDESESILNDEFQHRPELQAELFGTLADVYHGLSVPERAVDLRQRELELRRRLDSDQALPILKARRKLAMSRLAAGDASEALPELESILAELEAEYPEEWLERATTIRQISELHSSYGRREDAERYAQRAVAILEESPAAPLDLATALLQLGYVSEDQERRLGYQQRAYHMFSTQLGPSHPKSLVARTEVAAVLTNLGRYNESLEIYPTLIPILESEFGPMHEQTLTALNNWAFTYQLAGNFEAAIPIHQDVLERRRQTLGNDHREIGNSLQNLGALFNQMGRYDEAIAALTEAAEIFERVNLPGSPATAYPHITLADIYAKRGSVALLEEHARKAVDFLKGNISETHPAWLKAQCLLGDALIREGNQAEGKALIESAIAGLESQPNAPARIGQECRAALEGATPASVGGQTTPEGARTL